jgi:NitT/TauT family transport system substrate-binding protein
MQSPTFSREVLLIRRAWLRGVAAGSLALGGFAPSVARADAKQILVAEPLHNLGYLPLYVAIQNGFFGKDLAVSVETLPSSGSAHTDAVLGGKAWGFIGGPEHNAYADVKGANLRSICNIVDRGNVYFVARKGVKVGKNIRDSLKGRSLVTSGYGGTPNSITRYVAIQNKLDPNKDINLEEVVNSAIPAIMSQGKADIAIVSEPMLTKGIQDGVWEAPFYNVPDALGPYAYSTINVPLSAITSDPVNTKAFVMGVVRGLAFVRDNRDGAMAAAAKEFPDLSAPILKASMQRAYDDKLWEWSGRISPAAVKTAEAVVKEAGLLKNYVPYNEIIDLRYVPK